MPYDALGNYIPGDDEPSMDDMRYAVMNSDKLQKIQQAIHKPIESAVGAGEAVLSNLYNMVPGTIGMFAYGAPRTPEQIKQSEKNLAMIEPFMWRQQTPKGQEYTHDFLKFLEASKLPPIIPELAGLRAMPKSAKYADTAIREAYESGAIPQPGFSTVDLSKRRMFTLPKVEEKTAQMPAIKEQQGALPVEDISRREFLKRSASNVAANTILGSTPIGVLAKLAAEPVTKAVVEAPITQVAKVAEPIAQAEKIVTSGYKNLGDLVADAIQTSVFENTDIVGPGNIGYFWLNIVDSLRRKGINNKELWRSKHAAQRLSAAELSEEGELSRQNYKDISHVGGLLEKYGDYIEPKDYLDAMPKGADVPFMFEELLTDDAALRKWLQKLPKQYDVEGVTKTDIDNIMRDVFDVKPIKSTKKSRKK